MKSLPPVRVLAIEDDVDTARLLARQLSWSLLASFDVVHAVDLQSAFGHIERDRFDVALVDLGLPDGGGLTTIAAAAVLARHLPIVIHTAQDDDTTALMAASVGIQDFWIKGTQEARGLARGLLAAISRHRWACRAADLSQAEREARRSTAQASA